MLQGLIRFTTLSSLDEKSLLDTNSPYKQINFNWRVSPSMERSHCDVSIKEGVQRRLLKPL